MSDEMKKIVDCLQDAVDFEMERKAKLGYKAVILGKDGKPKVVSARTIVLKRRLQKKTNEPKKIIDRISYVLNITMA